MNIKKNLNNNDEESNPNIHYNLDNQTSSIDNISNNISNFDNTTNLQMINSEEDPDECQITVNIVDKIPDRGDNFDSTTFFGLNPELLKVNCMTSKNSLISMDSINSANNANIIEHKKNLLRMNNLKEDKANNITLNTNFIRNESIMSSNSSVKSLNPDIISSIGNSEPKEKQNRNEDNLTDVDEKRINEEATINDFNGLSMEERLKYDFRGFWDYLKDLITNENIFISIFFKKSLFFPTYIRIIRCFTNIIFLIGLNTILYSDKDIAEANKLEVNTSVS